VKDVIRALEEAGEGISIPDVADLEREILVL
jgi:hypothetical protein